LPEKERKQSLDCSALFYWGKPDSNRASADQREEERPRRAAKASEAAFHPEAGGLGLEGESGLPDFRPFPVTETVVFFLSRSPLRGIRYIRLKILGIAKSCLFAISGYPLIYRQAIGCLNIRLSLCLGGCMSLFDYFKRKAEQLEDGFVKALVEKTE